MFRKGLNITMVILLLGTTTGFAISKYYCDDRLVSVEFINETEACCEEKSCCHTQWEYLQLKVDFVFSTPPLIFINKLPNDIPALHDFVFSRTPINYAIALISHPGPYPSSSSLKTQLARFQVYLL